MNKQTVIKQLRTAIAVASAVVLPACGGGGGGGVDPDMTVPLKSAYANFINNSYSVNVNISGWSSGSTGQQVPVNGSGMLSWGAPTTTTLNGVTYLIQRESLVYSLNGVAATAYLTNVYNSSDYSQYQSTTGGSTTTYTYSSFAIPATVKAGDAGVIGQGVDRSNSNSNSNSITTSYSVKSNDATSLLVSVTNSEYAAGTLMHVDTTVYKVKTDGTGGVVSETFQEYSSGSQRSNLVFTVN
ncbi:MAG: hypothetical protein JSR83_24535 [Proteobacteria bacterium]|nr:hypothetical protein [Pseudomonadota bacterium]